ncbi:hypothetical protein Lgee_2222 [Legionella geestiana]|uniref:Uncharacterized protein n=1 Tax=Legionella geestiana TaxID=45065 RepID=A0A0W0TJT7_9GAMM|nr:hypothetical protein Lgee_2222 [Legionella geestiana]STX54220.1 Uncharacterised protein [Legionella geestiana]
MVLPPTFFDGKQFDLSGKRNSLVSGLKNCNSTNALANLACPQRATPVQYSNDVDFKRMYFRQDGLPEMKHRGYSPVYVRGLF